MKNHFEDDWNSSPEPQDSHAAVEAFVKNFRDAAHSESERDEVFWSAQRAQVRARAKDRHTWMRPVWAATATAAIVIAVVTVVPMPTSKHNPPKQQPAQVQQVDDEALLQSVSDTVNSSVPDALEPATILASEVDEGLSGAANNKGRNQ